MNDDFWTVENIVKFVIESRLAKEEKLKRHHCCCSCLYEKETTEVHVEDPQDMQNKKIDDRQ